MTRPHLPQATTAQLARPLSAHAKIRTRPQSQFPCAALPAGTSYNRVFLLLQCIISNYDSSPITWHVNDIDCLPIVWHVNDIVQKRQSSALYPASTRPSLPLLLPPWTASTSSLLRSLGAWWLTHPCLMVNRMTLTMNILSKRVSLTSLLHAICKMSLRLPFSRYHVHYPD